MAAPVFQIDPWSDVPVYQQIVDQIRLQVAAGLLHPGNRLEPVRQLAQDLGINASTVARAYQLLEREGVIATNRRGGSIIAPGLTAENLRPVREGRLRSIVERALVEALAQGYQPEEVEAAFDLQLAAWRDRRQGPAPAARAAPEATRLTRFVGSHDLALEALWGQARQGVPARGLQPVNITASYVGSIDGLLALLHGEAGLAGAHILDEESGEYNLPILRRLFQGQALCVVALAERQQGFIVPAGNPLGLACWADLARPGLRFVNRQPGAGTRTLLEHHLRQEAIPPQTIQGFDWAVPTHLAVAAAVAGGQADTGLGLYAAARAYGLGFVPLAEERYDLIFQAEDRGQGPIATLLSIIRSPEYQAVLAELGGYDTKQTGKETHL